MKVAIVFGVTGQDGYFLSNFLLQHDYEVVGVSRRSSIDNTIRLKDLEENDNFSIVEGDVLDPSSINRIFNQYYPDEVYNLAAQSHVATSFEQPYFTFQVNAVGTLNLLEGIRSNCNYTKFYQASTSEMFGSNYSGIDGAYKYQDEDTPFCPNSPYATSKLAAHHLVNVYRESYNLHASSGILFNHECLKYDYPLFIRNKKQNWFNILTIEEIAKSYNDGILLDNKTGMSITNLEVWDNNGWTDVKTISWFKNKDKSVKIVNARNAVYCISHDHKCILENEEIVKAEALKLGNLVKNIKYPNMINDSTISLEEAELIGMLIGDGSVSKSKQFTNRDKKLRKRFSYLWNMVTGGDTKYYPSTSGFTGKIVGRLDLIGGNDWLDKYNFYSISKDVFGHKYKMIPQVVLNSTKDIMEAFLVGYNNCDGLKKNSCTYKFKNFKTNSPVLAAGLLYLIHNVTNQKFNITVEESWKHNKQQFYYSINLLSNHTSSIDKYNKIQELKCKVPGISQREIYRQTGISRTFIRKVFNGYIPNNTHHLEKINNEIKKIIHINSNNYNNYWFDLETETNTLHAGLGIGLIHNSEKRGENFVTRKITRYVGRLVRKSWNELGSSKKHFDTFHCNEVDSLRLGNLDAMRDWGYAGDYVEAMWLMLQQDRSDDYIIATGEAYTIKDFLQEAFGYIGLNWKEFVVIDSKFYRPIDVPYLLGRPDKAEKVLQWKPKTDFKTLVKLMVEHDIELAQTEKEKEVLQVKAL